MENAGFDRTKHITALQTTFQCTISSLYFSQRLYKCASENVKVEALGIG